MITPFKIENESEADAFLRDLLAKEEYRSMEEVMMRADKLISDNHLRTHFINKAKELLKVQA